MGITRDLVEYDRDIQDVPFKVPKTGVFDTDDWGGVDYDDPDAIGANPVAKIYPDGTIVGSTDNGDYVKYPNGELECSGVKTLTNQAKTTSTGNIFRSTNITILLPYLFAQSYPRYNVMITSPTTTALVSWVSSPITAVVGLDRIVFSISSSISNSNTDVVKFIAKGKWK